MDANWFSPPLTLTVDGSHLDIDSVAHALELLESWPEARRGPVHKCALAVCRATVEGTMSANDARKALESFARITGLIDRAPVPAGPVAAAVADAPHRPAM
jgi:hypothetical protein